MEPSRRPKQPYSHEYELLYAVVILTLVVLAFLKLTVDETTIAYIFDLLSRLG